MGSRIYSHYIEDNTNTSSYEKRKNKDTVDNNRLKHKKPRLIGDSSGLQWIKEQIKNGEKD